MYLVLLCASVCDIQFCADCIETSNVVHVFLLHTVSDTKYAQRTSIEIEILLKNLVTQFWDEANHRVVAEIA